MYGVTYLLGSCTSFLLLVSFIWVLETSWKEIDSCVCYYLFMGVVLGLNPPHSYSAILLGGSEREK